MRLILASALGAALGVTLLLAGCSTAAAEMAAITDSPAETTLCAAGEYQSLVGQLAREVDTASLPQPSRLIMASDAPAAALEPERLTLVANGEGRVAEVVCS